MTSCGTTYITECFCGVERKHCSYSFGGHPLTASSKNRVNILATCTSFNNEVAIRVSSKLRE
jgi:hypothetical protein